jgi:hypothetical protein
MNMIKKMLKLKPNCECCDIDLPADIPVARICSFECTFCQDCAEKNFAKACPNCGGELVTRPVRPEKMLEKFPASNSRFLNEKHARMENYASRGSKP